MFLEIGISCFAHTTEKAERISEAKLFVVHHGTIIEDVCCFL
jgi:methyl coenzyme M reductase subunit C